LLDSLLQEILIKLFPDGGWHLLSTFVPLFISTVPGVPVPRELAARES